jgi:hypothetical protein
MNMNRLNTLLLVLTLVYGPVSSLSAQIQSDPAVGENLPKRWLTDVDVENQYGLPLMKSNPVGEPAITRWEYADYIVYFEYDRVLHTVRKNR